MSVRQGFTVEHRGDYRPAFAAAADAGFDYVELNMEARFSRDAVDPIAVREAADAHDLDLVCVSIPGTHSRRAGTATTRLHSSVNTATGSRTST